MAGIAALSVASSLPLPGTALVTYILVIMHQPVSFSHTLNTRANGVFLNGSRVCGHNWLLPHPPLPQPVWNVLVIFFLLLSEQKLNFLKALCCWTITQSSSRTTHHIPSDPFCSTFVSLLLPHTLSSARVLPAPSLLPLPPPPVHVYSSFRSPHRSSLPWQDPSLNKLMRSLLLSVL